MSASLQDSLAVQLQSARKRAGLSGRALAARSGVSQAAISRAESGQDVGHATLTALVRALPGLDPRALLGRAAEGARPASRRLWRFFHELHGLRARRVVLETLVEPDGRLRTQFAIRGLTSRRADLDDPTIRAAVMGAMIVGSPDSVLEVAASTLARRRRRLVVQDGEVTHRFELARDLQTGGIDYLRTESGEPRPAEEEMSFLSSLGRPFATGASLRLDHSAQGVVLRVRFLGEAPRALRLEAWPASLGTDPELPINRWRELYPHAPRWVLVNAKGVAELRIDRALPFTCFGLSWGHDPEAQSRAAPSPARAKAAGGPGLAGVLRRAREEAGWSRRELARRLGCSASSVMAVEDGREPRVSRLRDYARVLPELSPFELVDTAEAPGAATSDEAWAYFRDLFGVEVAEEVRSCAFLRDGTLRGDFRTESLTWSPVAEQDLLIRHGPTPLPTSSQWELDSLSARVGPAAEEPRVRAVRRGRAPAVHEYRFHASGRQPLVSLRRRTTIRGQFALTEKRAHEGAYGDSASRWPVRRPDAPERIAEALYVGLVTPARRLRLEVRFPRGCWPDEPRARAVSESVLSCEAWPDLSARAHAGGLDLRVDAAGRTLHLEVERPLVGLSYVLSWLLH